MKINWNKNFDFMIYKAISEYVGARPQFLDDKHVVFMNEKGEQICKFYGMKKLVVKKKFVLTNIAVKNIYEISAFINKYKGRR